VVRPTLTGRGGVLFASDRVEEIVYIRVAQVATLVQQIGKGCQLAAQLRLSAPNVNITHQGGIDTPFHIRLGAEGAFVQNLFSCTHVSGFAMTVEPACRNQGRQTVAISTPIGHSSFAANFVLQRGIWPFLAPSNGQILSLGGDFRVRVVSEKSRNISCFP
jgi:hypothetical protein